MAFDWTQRFVCIIFTFGSKIWDIVNILYQNWNFKPWIYMCMEHSVPNIMHNISTAGRVFHENLLCRIAAHSDSQMLPIWDLRTELGLKRSALPAFSSPLSRSLSLSLSLPPPPPPPPRALVRKSFSQRSLKVSACGDHIVVSCTSMQYKVQLQSWKVRIWRTWSETTAQLQWAQCDCFHLARVKGHKMRGVN